MASIKSLAFNLRHQVFINTLRFTGFNKKMDAVIETAVPKNLQMRPIIKLGSARKRCFSCYQYVLGEFTYSTGPTFLQ